jgi:gliding motility associated protien GldN
MGIKITSLTLGLVLAVAATPALAQNSMEAPHAAEWPQIKEKDVPWKKRVWRDIDLKDKENALFANTGSNSNTVPFMDMVLQGIKDGRLGAYKASNDRLDTKLSYDELQKEIIQPGKTAFDPKQVVKYEIKEDWVYDRVRKKMTVLIIAIAPMREVKTATGEITYEPMFWISYSSDKGYLATQPIANSAPNDGSTWYDVFERRSFKSKITKVRDTRAANYTGEIPGDSDPLFSTEIIVH